MIEYDYLIVGAGLFGAVFACEAHRRGKKSLVIDRRDHIGGNVYCENVAGINVHKYGPHVFHTSDRRIWDYINQFAVFNRFTNSPIANYQGEIYNLPFNMNTFHQLWGTVTPEEARKKIGEQRRKAGIKEPKNLEEKAISLVGSDLYEKLVKGYTEKQWGRSAAELPAFIIERLPVRFTYDNNYYNDKYQGVPEGGYNVIIEKMLEGVDIELGTDFFDCREKLEKSARKVVFTGMIDEFYHYRFGQLEYRSLRFEEMVMDMENFQGNAIVNYTDRKTPFTRIIEHKHFEFGTQPKTVITWEYPEEWEKGKEPFYPVNDQRNNEIFRQYQELAKQEKKTIFGGRLADYCYYDMHQVIYNVLEAVARELE